MRMIIFSILFLSAFAAPGQDKAYTLTGYISDNVSGEKLVNATVLIQLKNAQQQKVITGSDGSFTLKNLQPGNYALSVSYTGYLPLTRNIFVKSDSSLS